MEKVILMPGDIFRAKWVDNALCTVIAVNEDRNLLKVSIDPLKEQRSSWTEDGWNLEHTIHGFERGDYFDHVAAPPQPLISITNHVDEMKNNCLLVELTIDGAEKMQKCIDLGITTDSIMKMLYNNEPENNDLLKLRFSPKGESIYTRAIIPWEEESSQVQVANTWKTNESGIDLVARWMTEPKEKFYYYPETKENAERQKEITAKMSATTWAIYSQQSVNAAALETTARHNVVAIAFGKVDEVKRVFNYDNYKQDDKYYEKLSELSAEMEKELDFCAQKMRLISALTGNDYNSSNVVSKLYRDLRKVSHDKVNMNVKSDIDDKEEVASSPDPEKNDGGSVGEVAPD
jgi:hypothetical protein